MKQKKYRQMAHAMRCHFLQKREKMENKYVLFRVLRHFSYEKENWMRYVKNE